MGSHISCNCKRCRHVPSSIKAEHKRGASRAMCRSTKKAIRNGAEAPSDVSTGYKD